MTEQDIYQIIDKHIPGLPIELIRNAAEEIYLNWDDDEELYPRRIISIEQDDNDRWIIKEIEKRND